RNGQRSPAVGAWTRRPWWGTPSVIPGCHGEPVGLAVLAPDRRPGWPVRRRDQGGRRPTTRREEGARGRPPKVVANASVYAPPRPLSARPHPPCRSPRRPPP